MIDSVQHSEYNCTIGSSRTYKFFVQIKTLFFLSKCVRVHSKQHLPSRWGRVSMNGHSTPSLFFLFFWLTGPAFLPRSLYSVNPLSSSDPTWLPHIRLGRLWPIANPYSQGPEWQDGRCMIACLWIKNKVFLLQQINHNSLHSLRLSVAFESCYM